MCSIGWLRLKDSWILFKNRDRSVRDLLNKENIFIQDQELAGLGNKKLLGLTIGVNKYGVGITTAMGPKNEIPQGKTAEAARISEEVLRKCKTIKESKEMYLKLAKNLGCNYNVIIADSKQAIALELTPQNSSEEKSIKFMIRTNHFINLKDYNELDKEATQMSTMRFNKLANLVRKVKNSKDMISVLRFHSSTNDFENICRHDKYTETVASALFEVKKTKINSYYLLNTPPCKEKYKEKIILLKV